MRRTSVGIRKKHTSPIFKFVFKNEITTASWDFRYVSSWIDTRENALEKTNLIILFDKYIPSCLDNVRNRFKKITPIADISHIQTLCYLLDCLLIPTNVSPDCSKELYEMYFSFACIWAFGSSMFQDQVWIEKVHFGNFRNGDPLGVIFRITLDQQQSAWGSLCTSISFPFYCWLKTASS